MGSKFMGIMMVVIGIVVSAILLPMQTTACTTITGSNNITNLTGLSTVVPIVPLFILVMVFFGSGMLGYSLYKGSSVGVNHILRLVMGQLVIFFSLTIYPIIITSFNTLWTASSVTVQPVVGIIPLVILVALVFGSGWWLMLKGTTGKGKGGRGQVEPI